MAFNLSYLNDFQKCCCNHFILHSICVLSARKQLPLFKTVALRMLSLSLAYLIIAFTLTFLFIRLLPMILSPIDYMIFHCESLLSIMRSLSPVQHPNVVLNTQECTLGCYAGQFTLCHTLQCFVSFVANEVQYYIPCFQIIMISR